MRGRSKQVRYEVSAVIQATATGGCSGDGEKQLHSGVIYFNGRAYRTVSQLDVECERDRQRSQD